MPRYSDERKAAVLKKLLPPMNRSVPDVAKEEGISEQSLYNWRQKLRNKGLPVPGNEHNSEQWSAEARFAVVVETATLSERLFQKLWGAHSISGLMVTAEQ